jgi:large subunit ribosomal protein L21
MRCVKQPEFGPLLVDRITARLYRAAFRARGDASGVRFLRGIKPVFIEVMKTMFAVVRTGGKQYRVAPGDKIVIEKIAGDAGESVTLDDVLFTSEGAAKGITVSAEIIAQAKADKVIIFKKRRRHNYRRKNGHRQQHTILKITAVGSEKAPAAAKKEAAPKAEKPAAAPKAAKAETAPAIDASNLSLISGVGPTIEKKLRAAGIASWNDIAAWDDAAIEKFDTELKLGGRATKEEWIEQAKELLAGKEPRAKTDKAEKASGKDK